jgi:cell division protein FtsB
VPLLACLVGWGWWRGAVSVRESRRELVELVERRDLLREANRTLTREVEALRREREARARAAREALDVVSPSEVLVVVPPPTAAPPRR